jgi:hypothetical protein
LFHSHDSIWAAIDAAVFDFRAKGIGRKCNFLLGNVESRTFIFNLKTNLPALPAFANLA